MGCEAPSGVAGCPAGGTNSNGTTTGTPQYKTGRRLVEVALKYNF
jgi:hypothetical protein